MPPSLICGGGSFFMCIIKVERSFLRKFIGDNNGCSIKLFRVGPLKFRI